MLVLLITNDITDISYIFNGASNFKQVNNFILISNVNMLIC